MPARRKGDPWDGSVVTKAGKPDNRSVTASCLKKVEIDLFLLNSRREYKIYFDGYPFC